mmetsp:Transcript_38227/g.70582  ORF Transcript_38227/g.70582 Transcript_38227/m.70582 type:complete len:87 (+) Transcript_38227:182-442(+)
MTYSLREIGAGKALLQSMPPLQFAVGCSLLAAIAGASGRYSEAESDLITKRMPRSTNVPQSATQRHFKSPNPNRHSHQRTSANYDS